MPLQPLIEAQIHDLAARYGEPLRVQAHLRTTDFSPFIKKDDRIGEVCMVVRRPNGRLLTARKTFYPQQGMRLLTGGVGHGEQIEAALLREVDEETGLHTVIRRFLAVAQYGDQPEAFATFAFLLDEIGGTLEVRDPDEQIAEFREILPDELPAMARTLEQCPAVYSEDIQGHWSDWGAFRAVIHRTVYDALTGPAHG